MHLTEKQTNVNMDQSKIDLTFDAFSLARVLSYSYSCFFILTSCRFFPLILMRLSPRSTFYSCTFCWLTIPKRQYVVGLCFIEQRRFKLWKSLIKEAKKFFFSLCMCSIHIDLYTYWPKFVLSSTAAENHLKVQKTQLFNFARVVRFSKEFSVCCLWQSACRTLLCHRKLEKQIAWWTFFTAFHTLDVVSLN